MDVDLAEADTELWARLDLAGTAKETAQKLKADIPAVYAYSKNAEGGLKSQRYSGPQTAEQFVKNVQALLIRNMHAPQ